MKISMRMVGLGSLAAAGLIAGLTGCNKPSKDQILQALKENPGILAEAIKKDPGMFKEALIAAQEWSRQEQAREAQKQQDDAFTNPLKPKITDAQVFKGNPKAKVTIVEYTDLECPYCQRGNETMKEVLKKYADKVRITIKHLPLPMHSHAMPAAQYYEAIRLQNPDAAVKFADAVFGNQNDLRKDGDKFMDAEAKKLGIKLPKLKTDMKSPAVAKKVQEDMDEAKSFGFSGTPSFVVNGVPVRGAYPAEEFSRIVDRHLASNK